jgi:hypothetical protein
MKRLTLTENPGPLCLSGNDIPDEFADHLAGLKLLYSVPFLYLIADETLLPVESMRFFCIDENWTDALADGALSIGRNDDAAARVDESALGPALESAVSNIRSVRYGKVHENHREETDDFAATSEHRSGFLIRSALVRKWTGIEVTGFDGVTPLHMLRSDKLAEDVLICVFDGIVTNVAISEPKSGLRFGAYENDRTIGVRSVTEDAGFGEFIRSRSVKLGSNEKGRLDVMSVRDAMKRVLGKDITPSLFAFELMLAAQKAIFVAKGGGGS